MKLQDFPIVKNYPGWNNHLWDGKEPISVGAWVAKILNNKIPCNLSNKYRHDKLKHRWSFTGAINGILIGYSE